MKKYFSLYLFSLFIFFPLMASAAEEDAPAPDDRREIGLRTVFPVPQVANLPEEKDTLQNLQELREIVARAFPLPIYKDSDVDDLNEKLRNQEALSRATQEGVGIFAIPIELFRDYIFPCMDRETFLLKLVQTCRFFREFSRLPFCSLDRHCLTEGMPHAMPVGDLRFRTSNTQDGLLRLAVLVSVWEDNLCGWFGPDFLRSAFLSFRDRLPERLEGQSEEDLGALYPIMKVAVAAIQAGAVNEEEGFRVMELIREIRDRQITSQETEEPMSRNWLYLASLNPDPSSTEHNTFQYLTFPKLFLGCKPDYFPLIESQTSEAVARNYLMAGRNIVSINHCFMACDPQRQQEAIEIIKWCSRQPFNVKDFSYDMLIDDALELGRPDLALSILGQIVEWPDSGETLPVKVQCFAKYRDIKTKDWRIQKYLEGFASMLYLQHWQELSDHWDDEVKQGVVSLLAQAGNRGDLRRALDGIPDEKLLGFLEGSLLECLFERGCGEEAKELVTRVARNRNQAVLGFSFEDLEEDFFRYAIAIDRKNTLALLKSYVESSLVPVNGKPAALNFMATFFEGKKNYVLSYLKRYIESPDTPIKQKLEALQYTAKFFREEEKNYILSKIQSLNGPETEENENNLKEIELCRIFYYLGDRELCPHYYLEMLKKIGNRGVLNKKEFLKLYRKAGVQVANFEDLEHQDPFEVTDLVERWEDRNLHVQPPLAPGRGVPEMKVPEDEEEEEVGLECNVL